MPTLHFNTTALHTIHQNTTHEIANHKLIICPSTVSTVKRVGSSPRSSLALIYPACCKIQLGRMEPYMYRLQSRDLSFCMKPWPIPSFLCRTFAWIYWSEQSNIGSSIRQMRRTAVERGKDADNAPLLLGGQGRGRARYLNLVAEPMEAPNLMCCCRTILTALITLVLAIAGLEILTMDNTTLADSMLVTTSSSTTRTIDSGRDDDSTVYDLVSTDEPNSRAATVFQLSLTLDVTIDVDNQMQIALANQTGYYAAYKHDMHVRDGHSASFDRMRTRALTFASEALEHWGNGNNAMTDGRKLQDDASGGFDHTDDSHFIGYSSGIILSRFKRWCTMLKRVTLGRSSNWTMGTVILISGVLVSASVCCMMPQQPFRPHPMQHGPRSHVHQSDAGPPFIGTATLKVPPSWCVERNHVYSLRAWISDLILWASASDLDPVRHGPVAALQVQGTAKELIRELTPQQLQHGDIDPMTGQQLTGLMLLVTVLARRYAPLEAENTTKSIAEFLAFRRQPGETIDSLLVRFDILRNRAHARAGFAINLTGLTWLLLQSLGLGAEQWDRLLAPMGGQMPQNDAEFGGLLERIRRLFHLKEGRLQHGAAQGAMGDPGNFHTEGFFPTFVPDGPHANAFMCGGPNAPDPWSGTNQSACAGIPDPPSASGLQSNAYPCHAIPNEQCPTCGNYFQADGYSTDTSSDDGVESIPGETEDPVEAYLQYAFARKKWRRISNKYPRRYRKSFKSGFKGGKGFKSNSYPAFLPPNSFAGGKGGKSKSGGSQFKKRNPKDKNGMTLKCNICQSEEHLWRNCPRRNQQGDGSYATNAVPPQTNANVNQPVQQQQQLALMPSNMLWGPCQATSLPGVHFFGAELENLMSVSQAASVVSSTHSRKRASADEPEPVTPNAPSRAAPKWSPSFFPTTDVRDNVETLITNAPQPSSPPPRDPAPNSIHLGVRSCSSSPIGDSASAAANASGSASDPIPATSSGFGVHSAADASDGKSVHSQAEASDVRSVRMSREEQQKLREQSVNGLQGVLFGLGTQNELGQAVGLLAPNATPVSNCHVLSLADSLMPQHPSFSMPTMPQVPNAVPGVTWPQYMRGNTPQPPQHPAVQSDPCAGVIGYPPHDPGNPSFPWWEVSEKPEENVLNLEGSYHLRTRRQNGTVGLLVDPGAHDNLIGGATAQQMCDELKAGLHLRSMDKPLPVEGVGKSAQVADQAACIPMAVLDVFGKKSDATYTAPIIQDSMLPPLLGNRTLRKMQVIMDCGSGKLILPGPGGVEVKMSPGSKVFDLELTSSGHWVLPLYARNHSDKSSADDNELAFNMSCRRDRSKSPPRRRDAASNWPNAQAGDGPDAAAVTNKPGESSLTAEEKPMPMVKPVNVIPKVDNLAWVFSDKVGLRQRLLQEINFRTVHFYHDLHSRSQCQRLLNDLAHQCPLVLWIRFAGPCVGSGNKQDALRAENLVRLLAKQKSSNRYLIVEASDRSQVWNLQAVREFAVTLLQTTHQWCHYETNLKPGDMPCSSKLRLLTNFHVADGCECRCGPVQHVKSNELGQKAISRFEHVLRTVMHQVCLSQISSGVPMQMPAKGQPELKGIDPMPVLAEDLNTDATGSKKSVRFGSLHSSEKFGRADASSCKSKQHSNASSDSKHANASFDSRRDFWISHGRCGLIRVHVEPRNAMYIPDASDCPIALHALEGHRQTKLQRCISDALQQSPPILIDDDWRNSTSTDMQFHWVGTTSFTVNPKHLQPQGTEQVSEQELRPHSLRQCEQEKHV